jgi:hypothetical protein
MRVSDMQRKPPDEAMSEADTQLVLAMVDEAGQAVAPDEHRDLFDDYAQLLRSTRVLPAAPANASDNSSAADGAVVFGIGLALLGHLAARLLAVANARALEEHLPDAAAFVSTLIRRRDQKGVQTLAEQTLAGADTPKAADWAVLNHVVLIQINVLGATQAAGSDEE